ncbi:MULTISPECIES: RcnB family protein [unclassified Chelatococcus]|uniref:RcnB family protein n=1 Tax=unclassified Chelatococcus TaxID=2638111 RepID=UPI0020C0EF93|nr:MULTISPECIES: RcnB family protein [unclassified Chelatococcus]MCO5079269.1 RcnB family protein [Chelatococcus sp.]
MIIQNLFIDRMLKVFSLIKECVMKRLFAAAVAICFVSTSAFAQAPGYQRGPDHGGKPAYGAPRHHAQQPRAHRPHSPQPHVQRHQPPRWKKGNRLPPAYRGHVVRDYGRYHLRPPPRGYNWVRVDNNYLLIATATGLISSIIAGR